MTDHSHSEVLIAVDEYLSGGGLTELLAVLLLFEAERNIQISQDISDSQEQIRDMANRVRNLKKGTQQ